MNYCIFFTITLKKRSKVIKLKWVKEGMKVSKKISKHNKSFAIVSLPADFLYIGTTKCVLISFTNTSGLLCILGVDINTEDIGCQLKNVKKMQYKNIVKHNKKYPAIILPKEYGQYCGKYIQFKYNPSDLYQPIVLIVVDN